MYNMGRTSVALNSEITKRIKGVLKKSGHTKIGPLTVAALEKYLEVEETKQALADWEKIRVVSQYKKIEQLSEKLSANIKEQKESRVKSDKVIAMLKTGLRTVEDQVKYFKEEYEDLEKIKEDPYAASEKARKELREMDPELADAYDKAEEIHQKHMYPNCTPKERKELEANIKRSIKKSIKKQNERRKKLFKN